jgi:hypothetical protein
MISSRKNVISGLMGSAVALLITLSQADAAPVAVGGCAPNALKYKASIASVNTTSATLVNVSETGLSFIQGGTRPGCAIITFSALSNAFPSGTTMVVEAHLDGVPCQPSSAFFTSNPNPTSNTMSYVCEDVTPGRHRVQMKYRTFGAGTAFIFFRTTMVHFVR